LKLPAPFAVEHLWKLCVFINIVPAFTLVAGGVSNYGWRESSAMPIAVFQLWSLQEEPAVLATFRHKNNGAGNLAAIFSAVAGSLLNGSGYIP